MAAKLIDFSSREQPDKINRQGYVSRIEEAPGLSSVVDSTCFWVPFINNSSYRRRRRSEGERREKRKHGGREETRVTGTRKDATNVHAAEGEGATWEGVGATGGEKNK